MIRSLSIGLLFCISQISIAQASWVLKKNEDHIKVYTRNVSNSKIKEYKAISTLHTSMDHILNELLTAPKYTDSCKAGVSYYVKQLNDTQHVFYAYKDLPWPVRDRDVVTLITVKKISKTKYKLTIEGLPNGIPEKKQMIRIKQLMGHWLIEEKSNGVVMVTQQLFLNPEGNLPAFIVNGLLVKGPFKTFQELRHNVKTYGK